jgi:hypothetical protein
MGEEQSIYDVLGNNSWKKYLSIDTLFDPVVIFIGQNP